MRRVALDGEREDGDDHRAVYAVTPPVITVDVQGQLGDNGWYTSDVSVEWTVDDPESQYTTQGCEAKSIEGDEPDVLCFCSATSEGGTTSESVTIQRDATPPVIEFLGPSSVDIADQVEITCTVTDATSGVASDTCADVSGPAYDFKITKAHYLTAEATDYAGNFASAEFELEVTVSAAGMCQLVRDFVSRRGAERSLCSRIRAAERARTRVARAALVASFIWRVELAERRDQISTEHADALQRAARSLRASGGRGR